MASPEVEELISDLREGLEGESEDHQRLAVYWLAREVLGESVREIVWTVMPAEEEADHE
jgi:hypothetical protein